MASYPYKIISVQAKLRRAKFAQKCFGKNPAIEFLR